jgi:hypothetical protein
LEGIDKVEPNTPEDGSMMVIENEKVKTSLEALKENSLKLEEDYM